MYTGGHNVSIRNRRIEFFFVIVVLNTAMVPGEYLKIAGNRKRTSYCYTANGDTIEVRIQLDAFFGLCIRALFPVRDLG